ncbi:MAG: response regulator [Flavobacterium sp.]|nr:response regulator [Flavobacterium sp.]
MFQKILCIDDDPIALLLSKLLLTKSCLASEIVALNNGEEALNYLSQSETLKKNKENDNLVVFLDLNMPIMDGWEFLEKFENELYANYPNIKIILLSSSIDPSDIKKSNQFPMVLEFMSKPLSKEILKIVAEKLKL